MQNYINCTCSPFISRGKSDFPLRFLSFSVKCLQQHLYANIRDKEGISGQGPIPLNGMGL